MSERYPDEVLQRARQAYDDNYNVTSEAEELLLPYDKLAAYEAVACAAMRAVLEGHLAAQEPTVPLDTLTSVTVAGARAFWALKDVEKQHEALRVAVMVEVSNPHQDWPTARANLTRALNEAFAPGAASDDAEIEPPMRTVWLHGTDEEIGRQLREMSGYPVKGGIVRAASDCPYGCQCEKHYGNKP